MMIPKKIQRGKILKILFSKFLLYILYSLIFITILPASDMYMSNFTISAQIDKKSLKPSVIKEQFENDIMEVWASVKINHPVNNAKVSIVWYYQGKRIKQNDIVVEADIRLHAASLNRKKDHLFPLGKFRVDFILNGMKEGSVSFKFISSKKKRILKTDECIKPTKADDRNLIDDEIKIFPKIKKALSSLKLIRYGDAQSRFSVLAPSGWKNNSNLDDGTLMYLSKVTDGSSIAEYLIREIPLDEKTRSTPPKVLMQAISQVIREESGKTGAKPLTKPKIYELPDMTVSHFTLIRMIENTKIWEIHTVIFDEKYLYDVAIMTDKTWLETGRFLSSLASYGFWTKESCK